MDTQHAKKTPPHRTRRPEAGGPRRESGGRLSWEEVAETGWGDLGRLCWHVHAIFGGNWLGWLGCIET